MASPENQRLTLGVCCLTHGVQDGLSATLYVLLPVLAQALGLSYAQVGLLRATKSAANSLLELPSGLLAERQGERRLLAFGLASAGAGYLFLANAQGLAFVLACLFVAGVGSAFQHALSSSVVSATFDDSGRRSALGLYNSSGDAGKLVFTGLFSLLIGMGFAWQGIVAMFGLIAVILAGVVLTTLRRLEVGGRGAEVAAAGSGAGTQGWGIRDRAGFTALCCAVFLDTAVQASFLVFLAFLIADKDVPAAYAGSAVVLTLIGGMFGKAGCGYLAERLGVRASLALVQCATAAGIGALVVATPLWAFVILPVLGMFLQGSTSITYGSVSDLVRSDRQSRGFALIYSVSSLSSVAGPILFGLVGDHSGLASAMGAMAIVSLVAIAPSMRLRTGPSSRAAG